MLVAYRRVQDTPSFRSSRHLAVIPHQGCANPMFYASHACATIGAPWPYALNKLRFGKYKAIGSGPHEPSSATFSFGRASLGVRRPMSLDW